jgi:hypothetical protein
MMVELGGWTVEQDDVVCLGQAAESEGTSGLLLLVQWQADALAQGVGCERARRPECCRTIRAGCAF